MGLYRFGLSTLVVLFHFGGLGPLSGRVVVFTFFVLSGYLMALVLSRTYGVSVTGAGHFYLNRALRLLPPFAVVAALTLLFMGWRSGRGFYVDPLEPEWLGVSRGSFLNLGWQWAFHLHPWPPVAGGEFTIDPPTWSLVSEGCFYLAAPLLAALLRYAKPVFALVIGGSLAIAIWSWTTPDRPFDDWVYQNAFGSVWTFGLGMTLFALRDPLRRRLPERVLRWVGPVGLGVAGIFLLRAMRDVQPATEGRIYGYLAVSSLAILLLGLHREWPRWYREIDRRVGDLAYGVFLGHFLAALVMLALAEQITRHTGVLNPFGRLNTREFGQWTLAATIVLSLGVFRAVEVPVQRMRGRIRAHAGGSSVPLGPSDENAPPPPPPRERQQHAAGRVETAAGIAAMVVTVAAIVWLTTRDLPAPPAPDTAVATVGAAAAPLAPVVLTASTGHGAIAWTTATGGRPALHVAFRGPDAGLERPVAIAVPGRSIDDLRAAAGRTAVFTFTWRWRDGDHREHVALAVAQPGVPTQVVRDIGTGGRLTGPPVVDGATSGGAMIAWVERERGRWTLRTVRAPPPAEGPPQLPEPTTVLRGRGAPPVLGAVGADDEFAELAFRRAGRVWLAAQEGDAAWRVHATGAGAAPSVALDRSRALAVAARAGDRRVLVSVGQEPDVRVHRVMARPGSTIASAPTALVDQRGVATVVWAERDQLGATALRAVVVRPDGLAQSQVVARGAGALVLRSAAMDMQGGVVVLAERAGRALLLRREPLRPDGILTTPPRWRTSTGALGPGARDGALAPLAAGGALLGWWAGGAVRARIVEGPLPAA